MRNTQKFENPKQRLPLIIAEMNCTTTIISILTYVISVSQVVWMSFPTVRRSTKVHSIIRYLSVALASNPE